MAKRQPDYVWSVTRREVYERDRGLCQSPLEPPVCQGKQEPMDIAKCHIDHIMPLSKGGTNHASNLRLLCPVCHALREDSAHVQIRCEAIASGLIPATGWRELTW